jgi:hypothetical protein
MVDDGDKKISAGPYGKTGVSQSKWNLEAPSYFRGHDRHPVSSPEIPILVKDSLLPPKLFYSLEDAAKIAKCDSKDLLHYAGLGKIRFHIALPRNFHLQVGNFLSNILGTKRNFNIELLEISPKSCRKIELQGELLQSSFSTGWYIDREGYAVMVSLAKFDPSVPGDVEMGSVWETCSGDTNSPIELTIDRLIVMSFDLETFLEGTYKPGDLEHPPVLHEYKSTKLLDMNKAAWEFWGKNLDPKDKEKYPSIPKVTAWFQERGMSESQAKAAAAIIRPGFAKDGLRGLHTQLTEKQS